MPKIDLFYLIAKEVRRKKEKRKKEKRNRERRVLGGAGKDKERATEVR